MGSQTSPPASGTPEPYEQSVLAVSPEILRPILIGWPQDDNTFSGLLIGKPFEAQGKPFDVQGKPVKRMPAVWTL